jgi:hypothetical protein
MAQARAFHWKDRLQASGIHFGISLLIAALAGLLVFVFWYPYPYRDSSGGRELFLIVITVDVVLGPLITLTIFNRNKSRQELTRDLTTVGLIQLVALIYGLWTVCVARPVHLVFEVDRFRVIHAVEVPEELMDQAPPNLRKLPLTGPTPLAVRSFKDAREESDATLAALGGVALGARPDLWQSYGEAQSRVLAASRSLSELRQRFPQQAMVIDAAVVEAGVSEERLRYLPLVGRKSFGTVLLDARNAEIRGYLPLDSF